MLTKEIHKKVFCFNDLDSNKELPTVIEPNKNYAKASVGHFIFIINKAESNFSCFIIKNTNKTAKSSPNLDLLNEVRSDLKELSYFRKNWDGYNASPFKKEVISNAFQLLKLLFSKENYLSGSISDIFIEPESNGAVSFNVKYKNTNLKSTSISIGKTKISSYSKYKKLGNSGLMFDLEFNESGFLIDKINDATMGIFSYKYCESDF